MAGPKKIAENLAQEIIKDMREGAEWSVFPLCEQAIAEARASALEEAAHFTWQCAQGGKDIKDMPELIRKLKGLTDEKIT